MLNNQWIKYYPHFIYEESLRESHLTRINSRISAQVHLILFTITTQPPYVQKGISIPVFTDSKIKVGREKVILIFSKTRS